jgi:type II secretory pathway pseudopilin PulG
MNKVRRCITLVEMMIVMFLIAMIIGVVAYNYQGSLDEGKAFKTKTSMEKLQTILLIRLAEDSTINIDSYWKDIVKQSPLVQNANTLMKDGWGQEFVVRGTPEGGVSITSEKFEQYKKKNPGSFFKDDQEG